MEIDNAFTPSNQNTTKNHATDCGVNVAGSDDSPFQPWLPTIPSKEGYLNSYQDMCMYLVEDGTQEYNSPLAICSFQRRL